MRVLLVGIGGAGCRIVDAIQLHDNRSRTPPCTAGIAIDRDPDALKALTTLPIDKRIYYEPLDPANHSGFLPVDEIITRLQNLNPGDIDAFFICAGLGGELARGIPGLVHQLRSSVIEPVFSLVTLPGIDESDEIKADAADQIDAMLPLADGIILFDNDLGLARLRKENTPVYPPADAAGIKIPSRKTQVSVDGRPNYTDVNDMIAREISLLLRAGEASDRPGTEIGEVALDAGEIVNTIRGMGYIAIGYAREEIPAVQQDLISKLRPVTHSLQESHQRAQRLVAIARRAVLEGISVSCELSAADKALILIAGPPHELSMRGYMTVRQWIDRTIRGQEVRSGDFPIPNTRYIAVIILLAGLDRVLKIDSLRSIRDLVRQRTGPKVHKE